jgi:hypothetical protein
MVAIADVFSNHWTERPAARSKPDVFLKVTFDGTVDNREVRWIAASPPDYRYSYAGSGLPFGSCLQAFQSTPNCGVLKLDESNSVTIPMASPNTFIDNCGTSLVSPAVFFSFSSKGRPAFSSSKVGNGVPHRALQHPASRTGPLFYNRPWRVDSQHVLIKSLGA